MDVIFLILLWCCGILALVPSKTYFTNAHQTNGTDREWRCPHVNNIPGISCSCDIPHTVRCRGQASDPIVLLNLTKELRSQEDPSKSVSLLDLTIHRVGRLPLHTFKGLNLFGLIISKAGLTYLSRDEFLGLEDSLTALGVTNNNLTKVPTEALRNLNELQRLDLSGNSIESLTSHAFPSLFKLRNLNMAKNELAIIEQDVFESLPQLKELDLTKNQLQTFQVNEKIFFGLRQLTHLSLQSNSFRDTLNSEFLSFAPRLVHLDLSHNSFTKITIGALEQCGELRQLDLSNNKIDIIVDHAFKYLSKLVNLDLSHNQIISVSGWSLAHLPQLVSLSIADNTLFAVTADLLHQLPNLLTLDVSTNDISLMQPHVFNFTPLLQSLSLKENPLHCDCSLSWLWDWLISHPKLTNEDKESAVCTTPSNLENAPIIELNSSDLSCTKEGPDDYYHDAATDYEELHEFHLSDAQVSLQEATWVDESVQLVWHVDQRAVPYACQALHIYEQENIDGSVNQILAEKLEVNCSSESQTNPYQVVVTVSGKILSPGSFYRYCLVLIEKGTDDHESFLPGCSKALLLSSAPTNFSSQLPVHMMSLTAGSRGTSLIVQSRFENHQHLPCSYNVFVVRGATIAQTKHLNCSEARHSFQSLPPADYLVCVQLQMENKSLEKNLIEIKHSLRTSSNVSATLEAIFPACTEVKLQSDYENFWNSSAFLTVLFTLPGLALIIVLYVLGRRVWKGGGVPWKWDPRASKRVKYFLYTGEITPTVSLDSLPEPESSV